MSATNFNTKNDTFRKLLGNGLTYTIPRFQRDYSWGEDEWEDLWQDILGTIKDHGETAHYMGYLVLQSADDKVFEVIDGQQRLTTLSLIILAVLKNLQRLVDQKQSAEDNQKRYEQIRQTYIGYLDPVTLVSRSKLKLNRNNDNYFQTYVVPLRELPQRRITASEHALRKAFEWFDRKVQEYVRGQEAGQGIALAKFVEMMADRLFFTVITVTDELNAYKVFETLNSRGVRLSATDLLKNHLFYVLSKEPGHEHELRVAEDRWEAMVGKLGSESFPDFLRVHWNSRHSFVRHTELFKVIRDQIKDKKSAFELLNGMEEDMDIYLALSQQDTAELSEDVKSNIGNLRMFGVRQPFPLLLATKRKLGNAQFPSVLKACVIISFRYNVIGNRPTSEQEKIYSQVALGIARGEISNTDMVLSALTPLYPKDDAFVADFRDKSIRTVQSRNKKVVRYILGEIERHVAGLDLDAFSDRYSIEHILPEHPDRIWDGFSEENIDSFTYRLGNLALLQKSQNNEAQNNDFPVKRLVYANSEFALTRKLAEENTEWTPDRIDSRQVWLARQATAVWRISQMS